MRKHIQYVVVVILICSSVITYAQTRQDKDTLNTEVIDVVKPYTPSISDAFKVKEIPTLNDETTTTKKKVRYNIFSFPVASTYTPDKGKAVGVKHEKSVEYYNNYASLGVGNYTNILGDLFLSHKISKTDHVLGALSHHSSAEGIRGVVLDHGFSNSKAILNYASRQKKYAWNLEGGFQYQNYNWYGLPEPYASNQSLVGGLDVSHAFYNTFFETDICFDNSLFNSMNIFFRHFGDDLGSAENRFVAKSNFDIPIGDNVISSDIIFDYLDGGFDRSYLSNTALNYSNFLVGYAPYYEIDGDNLTVNLGASLVLLNNTEANESKFYVYPNITMAYKMVEDILTVFGGVKGDLEQHSYYDFSTENPFVSPTLFIAPTDKKYKAYLGLKGKLSSNMSYSFSGAYSDEQNKALFINNGTALKYSSLKDYEYGNSFGIVYDDIKTINISGEINADVTKNFKMLFKADYFTYTTENQAQAWNLPDISASLFLDYQIDTQWFVGTNLFYVGERTDQITINDNLSGITSTTSVIDGFLDVNLHVGCHLNKRISLYFKTNNLTNNNYSRWQNLPVQGVQALVGATFKF